MKIAVTTQENQVFQHFGKCPAFTIYQVEDGKIESKKLVDATGSGHSALAGFLQAQGVDMVICGGIGGGAKMALQNAGIQLVAGAAGDIDQVVEQYLSGQLVHDPNFQCSHHHGEHEEHNCGGNCGGHCGH